MTILDLLKGKTVKYMTDAKVEVDLVIEEVTEDHHSQDLEPSTQANDWYPASRSWTTLSVKFTNGFVKRYDNISQIKIVE